MNASEIMTENPRTVLDSDSIADALEALSAMQVRHLPVVDADGNLVGMLSDRDLAPFVRWVADDVHPERRTTLATRRVAELMSADVVSVDLDSELSAVIDAMLSERVGAVPVVDADGSVAGIISYVDVLRALAPAA